MKIATTPTTEITNGREDPTQEQIAAMCAEIRKEWTDAMFLKRSVFYDEEQDYTRWTVPRGRYHIDQETD